MAKVIVTEKNIEIVMRTEITTEMTMVIGGKQQFKHTEPL
jgi:hypothetical protein